MLKNVKSIYMLKNILSYLYEKRKLELVQYSKKLQKKISISIINYKFFAHKYIIYETDRKAKEYHSYSDT